MNITHCYSSGIKLKTSRKCLITGGWCSREEWPKDKPCKCDECQAYLCETLDHLNRLADETIKIYQAHNRKMSCLLEAIQLISQDADPEIHFRESKAYQKIWEAFRA